jgi:HK97 family phage prohead protease
MSDLDTRMPIRTRAAATLEVRHPKREIDIVAVPYDEPAEVFEDGRWVTEDIARGAFDGIERRANRIKVLRGHNVDVLDDLAPNVIGRAMTMHPDRDEGLVATLRISHTSLGDDTLELADDGVLDASIGFAPMTDGIRWNTRSARTITRAFLHHIALVPYPAYEGANVLAVRAERLSVGTSTPLLDRILAERLAAQYHLGE